MVIVSRVPEDYSRNPARNEDLMGAAVTVLGMPSDKARGLAESQAKFRKHHAEVGDVLMNLAEGRELEDSRPAYQIQEFPRMIYHAQHGEMVVYDPEEMDQYLARGYRREPYPSVQVAIADPKTEKIELQQKLREKDGQIATLSDMLERMEQRLKALEGTDEPIRRGPGRPPKVS